MPGSPCSRRIGRCCSDASRSSNRLKDTIGDMRVDKRRIRANAYVVLEPQRDVVTPMGMHAAAARSALSSGPQSTGPAPSPSTACTARRTSPMPVSRLGLLIEQRVALYGDRRLRDVGLHGKIERSTTRMPARRHERPERVRTRRFLQASGRHALPPRRHDLRRTGRTACCARPPSSRPAAPHDERRGNCRAPVD